MNEPKPCHCCGVVNPQERAVYQAKRALDPHRGKGATWRGVSITDLDREDLEALVCYLAGTADSRMWLMYQLDKEEGQE